MYVVAMSVRVLGVTLTHSSRAKLLLILNVGASTAFQMMVWFPDKLQTPRDYTLITPLARCTSSNIQFLDLTYLSFNL